MSAAAYCDLCGSSLDPGYGHVVVGGARRCDRGWDLVSVICDSSGGWDGACAAGILLARDAGLFRRVMTAYGLEAPLKRAALGSEPDTQAGAPAGGRVARAPRWRLYRAGAPFWPGSAVRCDACGTDEFEIRHGRAYPLDCARCGRGLTFRASDLRAVEVER